MSRHDELAKPKDAQVPRDYVHLPKQETSNGWDLIAYAIVAVIWLWIIWVGIGGETWVTDAPVEWLDLVNLEEFVEE